MVMYLKKFIYTKIQQTECQWIFRQRNQHFMYIKSIYTYLIHIHKQIFGANRGSTSVTIKNHSRDAKPQIGLIKITFIYIEIIYIHNEGSICETRFCVIKKR